MVNGVPSQERGAWFMAKWLRQVTYEFSLPIYSLKTVAMHKMGALPPLERLLPIVVMQFFTGLADRHAALRRQKALEGALLREATAAVWAAQQGRLGEGPTEGSGVHSVGTGTYRMGTAVHVLSIGMLLFQHFL